MIIAANSVTQDYQVLFNGVMLGPGTNYNITNMKGFLDLGGVRSPYVSRPHKTGAYVQPHFAEGATLDIAFHLVPTDTTAFADAVAALQAATYAQTTPLPLTFKLPGRPVLAMGVQCLNRAIPVDQAFSFGFAQSAALQFFAPDPRQYGLASSQSAGLRSVGTGLAFPVALPMDFGATPTGGRLQFTNTGTTSSEPIFTISGALAAGFTITYIETGQTLTYSAPVGSPLVIDCGAGTVMTQGQDRSVYLTQRNWFSVPGGSTATFAFASLGSETAAGNPDVQFSGTYAPAYI